MFEEIYREAYEKLSKEVKDLVIKLVLEKEVKRLEQAEKENV